jgi:signal transduction histidine kinase
MLFANIILGFTSFIALFLGMFILANSTRRLLNQVLAAFIFSIFIWQVANLATNLSSNPELSLFFARSTLIGPVLLSYFFLIFSKIFIDSSWLTFRKGAFYFALPFFLLLLSPSSLNIESTEAFGRNTKAGSLYFILIPMILTYFLLGYMSLANGYRKTRDKSKKAQLRLIFIGSAMTLIPAVVANGLFPALGYNDAVFYGPSTVIFVAVFMTIAIARHKLLDARLVIARVVAYVLFLVIVGLGFVVLVVSLPAAIIGVDRPTIARQIYYTVAIVLLSVAFQPLKRFIDKVTNSIFYRDAYDSRAMIGELNNVLVSSTDLNKLLESSAEVITRNVKPEYCVFMLNETSFSKIRLIGNRPKNLKYDDVLQLAKDTKVLGRKVIVADRLEQPNLEIQHKMSKDEISTFVHLSASAGEDGVGYMVLGTKKSGNSYNYQDINVLEIVADALLIAIQNALSFEEIQQFNITLQQKIDEATIQLKRANNKLIALNDTKDDFISMASHQLRTPLTAVKGNISMIMDGDFGKVPKTVKDPLNQAYASSERMVGLIADLLNVSRLRTGKFAIQPVPSNLHTVVKSELKQLQETAKAHKLTLTYDAPEEFPTLMLDEIKIRQVIMNFIDNAIYYTPAGGHISVALKHSPHSIEFTVKDDGIGVPRHLQKNLFTKFYRADNAQKMRPDGTGIGLFMAKKVIIASGGSVIFKSTEGKGSTFGFVIPLTKLAHTPVAPPEATSVEAQPQ